MRPNLYSILVMVESNSFARVKIAEKNPDSTSFLFIQDVCGTNEYLKDTAQSVMVNYMSLMKTTDNFFLGTNNPSQSEVTAIPSAAALSQALSDNRAVGHQCEAASIGSTLDAFYATTQNSIPRQSDGVWNKVNVIHVTTVGVDSYTGSNLHKIDSYFDLDMIFVGITDKHELFANAHSFDEFPGQFAQTYDPEIAILHLVNTFGSDTKPVTPSLDNYPRCTNKNSSSAQKIFQSVTKYFDIPDVKQIDQDDDTCEFNTDQLEDKTQFTGTMYANSTTFGVETFCNSNMDVYPDLIPTSDYKQAAQVMLQKVIDSYSHWYNNQIKTDCHCFDNTNPKTTKIILWTPLSPTSLDTVPVSFAGFDVVNFKHIVMPFGFSYTDSPLWRSLVPDQSQWTGDASLNDYDVDDIVQDIWTITCRMAGHIESSETAEPVNPYTTKKPRVPGDGL